MVELLVTIVLVAVFFSAMIPFLVAAQNRNAGDNMRNVALQVARDRIEKIRQLDYDSVTSAYLNASGPPSTPGGQFGTQWIAGTGSSQKTFDVTYAVSPVPAGAAAGQESYKQVTVSVVWEGAPSPQAPVVLQTDVSRQYFGPQIVDLMSPDAAASQDVSTITAGGQVRLIATVASSDLAQLTGTPAGEVDFTVTDVNGNLVASGSQSSQLNPSYPTPGIAGQYEWLWDSSTAGSGYYIFTAHAVSGSRVGRQLVVGHVQCAIERPSGAHDADHHARRPERQSELGRGQRSRSLPGLARDQCRCRDPAHGQPRGDDVPRPLAAAGGRHHLLLPCASGR